MRKFLNLVFVAAICFLLTACATENVQKDLAKTFVQLQDEGKLPGLPPGADAEIHIQTTAPFEGVKYPYSRDIFVMKGGADPSCYTYKFIKLSKTDDWELVKVWVTNQNGDRSELKVP